jgi:HEAT repeat protein
MHATEEEAPYRKIQRLKREGDVAALIQELYNPDHSGPGGLRALVVRALGKVRDPRAVEPLARLVSEDTDEIVAATAARSLGEIGHDSAIPTLVHAVEEGADLTKAWAADSLGKLGARHTAPKLVQLLGSQNRVVRRAAAQALGRVGDRSMIGALSQAANGEKWWERGIYRRSIRRIRSRSRN